MYVCVAVSICNYNDTLYGAMIDSCSSTNYEGGESFIFKRILFVWFRSELGRASSKNKKYNTNNNAYLQHNTINNCHYYPVIYIGIR